MERCAFILLLPILLSFSLSLSLLTDASSNLLPLRSQENNEADDPVILQDASEQNSVLRLPSEKQNEMEIEVPRLVRRPWDGDQLPKVTHDWFSVAPRLREKESDFVSRPTEREGESILPVRDTERESDSIFLRGGRKGWRFGHPGAGCHHHHGGEMKFGHRRGYGNHFRFRPQFILSFFTVPGDARPHGEEAVSSSIIKFPGEFQPRDQNEEPEFKPQERAFDRIGEGFPERVHSRPWGHHLRLRPQFPRSSSFPSYGDHGEEAVSSSFRSFSEEFSLPGAENEELGKRVFESIGEDFPEREFPNGEERKDGRHEDEAAPWMDWLRSFFNRH